MVGLKVVSMVASLVVVSDGRKVDLVVMWVVVWVVEMAGMLVVS